jgi:hypothetical protein
VGKNNFEPSDSPIWQFGQVRTAKNLNKWMLYHDYFQIFPLILLAIPVLNTARAVSEFIHPSAEE